MDAYGFSWLLKQKRRTRRLSQEQLAELANVSTRHLSCLETGKAQPSREMVLQLARAMQLDLRDGNLLLSSAGYAAVYSASALESLALAPVHRAVELMLAQQEPYGAILVDRCWNVLRTNEGAARMLSRFVDPDRVSPHIAANLVRAALHPDGLRPFIVNWEQVAALTLDRAERACAMFPHDEPRHALRREVLSYPGVAQFDGVVPRTWEHEGPVALIHLRRGVDEARLFTMLTTIGTPLDVTAQDLTLESFFPADDATATWFRALAAEASF